MSACNCSSIGSLSVSGTTSAFGVDEWSVVDRLESLSLEEDDPNMIRRPAMRKGAIRKSIRQT